MGLHYIGPGGFTTLIKAARACSLPFAAILNEVKAVEWLRTNSPQTIILFRVTGQDGGLDPDKVRTLLSAFKNVPAHFFSLANEWLPRDAPALLAFDCARYIDAMDTANEAGLQIVVGDLNTGHPDLSNPANLDAMRPMLAKAEREGHPLNVHYYARGADPMNDPDALLWQRLTADYPRLRVIIGELGILENGGAMTPDGFANLLRYDARLTEQVIGAALYTLTDTTWRQCDVAPYLDAYAAHVKAWKASA